MNLLPEKSIRKKKIIKWLIYYERAAELFEAIKHSGHETTIKEAIIKAFPNFIVDSCRSS